MGCYRVWLLLVGVAACRYSGPTQQERAEGERTERVSSAAERNGSAAVSTGEASGEAAKKVGPGDAPGGDAPEPQLVEYAPERRGFLYRPEGSGPFPVMVWNHGSESKPGWRPELARFYLGRGWAFFVPHRRGHGRSPGEYIGAVRDDATVVAMQDEHNEDVVAAIEWVKKQPGIEASRVVVSGCSYGGIQTLITAAKPVGIRAAIAFAPAAMRWRSSPLLRERLVRAAREARVPTLLIQAENDYDLSPSKVVGAELEHSGHGRAKVYPASGDGAQAGHSFCVTGAPVWGADVFAFIDAATK